MLCSDGATDLVELHLPVTDESLKQKICSDCRIKVSKLKKNPEKSSEIWIQQLQKHKDTNLCLINPFFSDLTLECSSKSRDMIRITADSNSAIP
ncbi:hypothetical protein NQ318_013392 [Aromia moschata]|uniref:Uncharacterized protein n=1 Tax=Aromia moschata TaxID=1265417 RepID=A0AAV8Y0Y7_9CUCU|nr:hypothetical protein NQ318_013392 [Aromia moschata]